MTKSNKVSAKLRNNIDRGLWFEDTRGIVISVFEIEYTYDEFMGDVDTTYKYRISFGYQEMSPHNYEDTINLQELEELMRVHCNDMRYWRLCDYRSKND